MTFLRLSSPLLTGATLASVLVAASAQAATYYVAPAPLGRDTNAGSEAQPFASMARAQTAAQPGDTVFLKGGRYVFNAGTTTCASQTDTISGVVLSKSGTADQPINYFAAPGETPVLDFDGIRDSCRIKGILLSGSFVHLRGLELQGVRQNNNLNHESWGVWIQGSNNVLETLNTHNIMGPGVFIQRGSNNLVLNCDSHDNLDELTSNGAGESADGFGCHVSAGETGNVFRGCRAWWNSDDGYDFINARAACTVEGSWAWYNGYRPGTLTPIGNGNGFKGGGYGADPATFPANPARHVVRQNLSVLNRAAGFYANHHPGPLSFFNNTGFGNHPNFNMLGMSPAGDDTTTGEYRNNIALGGTAFSNRNNADDASNSWSIAGVTVSEADFQGVSEMGLDAPRQADGSLPVLPDFHLVANSDAIDRGVDLNLPFAGEAPDLGAFETGLPTPAAPPAEPPASEAPPADMAPPAGMAPASEGGGTPAAGTPTFGLGGTQGELGGADPTGSGVPGSNPADAADAGAPRAGVVGSGAPSGGLPNNGGVTAADGGSDGCACSVPRGGVGGTGSGITLAVLALFGLRRRTLRANART